MSNGISEWSNKQLVKWQNSFSLPLRAGTKLFVVKRDAVAMSKKNFSQRWGAGGREGGGRGEGRGGRSEGGLIPMYKNALQLRPRFASQVFIKF